MFKTKLFWFFNLNLNIFLISLQPIGSVNITFLFNFWQNFFSRLTKKFFNAFIQLFKINAEQ